MAECDWYQGLQFWVLFYNKSFLQLNNLGTILRTYCATKVEPEVDITGQKIGFNFSYIFFLHLSFSNLYKFEFHHRC